MNLIPYNPGASSIPDGYRAPQHQRVERTFAELTPDFVPDSIDRWPEGLCLRARGQEDRSNTEIAIYIYNP